LEALSRRILSPKPTAEEKEKDRDLVRGIPEIVARAGYTIVKSGG
jgi:hypothetical protein